MARVLFLTQVLPHPLNSGAKIRAYYVLRQLARTHDVTLVSFVREDDDAASVAHLASFCSAVHPVPMQRSLLRDGRALVKSLLTGMPVVIARDEIGRMRAVLRGLLAEAPFDVVHADQTSMVQYALYVRERARREPRLVLDAHNALYRVPERMARHERNVLRRALYRREARALQRYEAAAYAQFDHIVFVTEIDRATLCHPQPSTSNPFPERGRRVEPATSVIPICVDPEDKPVVKRCANPRAVTHLGTMFWPPNVEGVIWFAREVWPRVVDRVPDAHFVIIGKHPPDAVRQLPDGVRSVYVTGYVQDPEPYLAETAVFIVPLRAGGGMRVKIVDAWCWGVPVVSTSIGAEGIAFEDGDTILIADQAEALADAVVRVLEDPALGQRLRDGGRRCVEERYDWRRVYGAWDEVYNGVTQGRKDKRRNARPQRQTA